MDYRDTMPTETIPKTEPVPNPTPLDRARLVASEFIDETGHRFCFGRDEMNSENETWMDFIYQLIAPPKPALRLVARFWIHKAADVSNPIYFDDDQICDEAEKLTHLKLTPEEAAKKLGFKADWFVVEEVVYKDKDGNTFSKFEPVEEDGKWFPATEEEISATLAALENPAT